MSLDLPPPLRSDAALSHVKKMAYRSLRESISRLERDGRLVRVRSR
jgi:hypothetical protein